MNEEPKNETTFEDLQQRRIIDLTGEELLRLMFYAFASTNLPRNDSDLPPFVYGIDGLARLLNVSTATANRIKKSGVINDAITQTGRTIIIDSRKTLQLLHDGPNSVK